jgi:hypothetical protein
MRMIDPASPDSPGSPLNTGKVLATTGVHPHIASAARPVACLAGLLPPHVISALTTGLPARRGQPVLAGLVTACHRKTLQIPGIGVTGIAAITGQLPAAGLIGDTGQDIR